MINLINLNHVLNDKIGDACEIPDQAETTYLLLDRQAIPMMSILYMHGVKEYLLDLHNQGKIPDNSTVYYAYRDTTWVDSRGKYRRQLVYGYKVMEGNTKGNDE